MRKIICLAIFLYSFASATGQEDTLAVLRNPVSFADTLTPNYRLTGKLVNGSAAQYNRELDGTKTASGEVFLNIRLTAASNDFPLNSWVRVTNPKNRKQVILRVNDRLSARQKNKGVALYISEAAAKDIGLKPKATIKIKIEEIVAIDSISFANQLGKIPARPKTDSITPNTFKPYGKAITGTASFYSFRFDGSRTANGEIYHSSKLSAASNNFALNTWVLVTNLKNKKSVIVKINDRMHPRMKAKGRVVDMSREAARLLDYMNSGLTKVKVQPVRFIFSPALDKTIDSLKALPDSAKAMDSLKIDSVRTEAPRDNALRGIASFYNASFEGIRTATGEKFHNGKLSAASNNFALNTWVRVTNLANNRSVVLRINDRMHPRMKKKGRVVDLSRIAAQKLGFIQNGLAKVKVEIVPRGTLR